jgi:hypothetical protein
MSRAPRPKDPNDVQINYQNIIHNPHALPLFREDIHKRQREDGKVMPGIFSQCDQSDAKQQEYSLHATNQMLNNRNILSIIIHIFHNTHRWSNWIVLTHIRALEVLFVINIRL